MRRSWTWFRLGAQIDSYSWTSSRWRAGLTSNMFLFCGSPTIAQTLGTVISLYLTKCSSDGSQTRILHLNIIDCCRVLDTDDFWYCVCSMVAVLGSSAALSKECLYAWRTLDTVLYPRICGLWLQVLKTRQTSTYVSRPFWVDIQASVATDGRGGGG